MAKRLTREESRARTRARLLESARMVMAREGYEGASVDRIAEEAGFSKGAFYSNFSSKEEIFLELLESHSMQDVDEIAAMLEHVDDPHKLIDVISNWAAARSADASWGMLALELFRRAKKDETFGDRHANLFRSQWIGIGELLLRLFPKGAAPGEPEALGAIVCELTYGAASSFVRGPSVDEMVRLTLTSLFDAYGRREAAVGAPESAPEVTESLGHRDQRKGTRRKRA
jgi:TetR/AcrR family transcriptional regulator, transcriptional repressor of aconitase